MESTDESMKKVAKPVVDRVVLPAVETQASRPRRPRLVADSAPRVLCRFCMEQVERVCDPTLMLECERLLNQKSKA